MSKKRTISLAILNSLTPQASMLNAKIDDIKDRTYEFHSLIPGVGVENPEESVDFESETPAKGNDRVKAKYVDKETGKSFTLGIRSLLGLPTVEKANEGDYDAAKGVGENSTTSVADRMTEQAGDATSAELPEEFKVIDAKIRMVTTDAGKEEPSYPAFAYVAFEKRSKEIEELNKELPVGEKLNIWDDRTMLASLAGTDLLPKFKHKKPEAGKEIVISI